MRIPENKLDLSFLEREKGRARGDGWSKAAREENK